MAWMKELSIPPEKLPILFIILLVINNTRGVPMPSPMAPTNPKIMRNISWPSACIKMDRIEPLLFLFFIAMEPELLWSPPPPPIWCNPLVNFLRSNQQ